MDKVVIVMPTYKEKVNMGKMVPQLFEKEFPKIKNAELHLLVVNDLPKGGGTDDGTGDVVRGFMKKYKNLHIIEHEKEGLGWAYVRGMRYAMDKLEADAVLEMDADFQHPTRFVKPMVEAYLAGADYAIGSRYIKGGSVPKEWAFSRKAISFFGNLFIRLVLLKPGIHDLTTGFRLARVKGVLDKIKLEELMELSRFAYKVDLLYQCIKNSKKVVEVPLEFAPRLEEASKFSGSEMVSTFKVAIILGIKDKIRLLKFATVGTIGFTVNFLGIRFFRSIGFPEVAAWLVATEIAIVNNYVFNNIWTFKDKKIGGIKETIRGFGKFNLTSVGAIVIQSVFGPLGVALVGAKYDFFVLAVVIVFLVLPYNYVMYNLVVWKTWKAPARSRAR